MVVALVEKPDKPVDLVSGLLAESPYRLKHFLGGNVGRQIERILGALRPSGGLFADVFVGGVLCTLSA